MLVRIDAAFEAVLGIALLVCAATGALDGSDFPRSGRHGRARDRQAWLCSCSPC